MKKLVANVKFQNSTNGNPFSSRSNEPKTYRFLTTIEDLKFGDTVVVDTMNGLQIANFVEYSDLHQEFGETFNHKVARYIVQKVDLSAHNARIEAAEELEKIKKLMEVRRKKAAELEIYEILAKQDPEMAELLNKFKNLQEEV